MLHSNPLLLAALWVAVTTPTASAQTAMVAHPTGAEAVPIVPGAGVADAFVVVDPIGATFSYHVSASFLDASPALEVVHATPGASGPALFTLPGSGPVWSGTSPTLTAQQLADLQAGELAFNVVSPSHPTGQIRGQITVGATHFGANLDGTKVVPAHPTTAVGYGNFSLSGSNISFTIKSSIWFGVGRIRDGELGVNGPIVASFGQSAVGQWNGQFKPTAVNLAKARSGKLYVEIVETGTNATIRGQLRPDNGNYGSGCAGSSGTPATFGFVEAADPTVAPPFTANLSVFGGVPNGATVLFLSTQAAKLPLGGGCTFYMSPAPVLSFVLPLSASGNVSVQAPIPALPTVWLQLQAFVPDATAPNGQYSASAGLSFLAHGVLN